MEPTCHLKCENKSVIGKLLPLNYETPKNTSSSPLLCCTIRFLFVITAFMIKKVNNDKHNKLATKKHRVLYTAHGLWVHNVLFLVMMLFVWGCGIFIIPKLARVGLDVSQTPSITKGVWIKLGKWPKQLKFDLSTRGYSAVRVRIEQTTHAISWFTWKGSILKFAII